MRATSQSLFRRGETFWFRRVAPQDIQKKIGRIEIRLSLRTNVHKTGVVLSRRLTVLTDTLFDEVRKVSLNASISAGQLKAVLENVLRTEIQAATIARVSAGPRDEAAADAAATAHKTLAETLTAGLRTCDFSAAIPALARALDKAGITLPESAAEFKIAAHAAMHVLKEAARVNAAGEHGEIVQPCVPFELITAGLVAEPEIAQTQEGNQQTTASRYMVGGDGFARQRLQQPMSIVHQEMMKDVKVSPKTRRDYKLAVRYLMEVIGDKALYLYDQADAMDLKHALERLPQMYGRKPYANMTALEAIEAADAREEAAIAELKAEAAKDRAKRADLSARIEAARVPRLKPVTINKHLRGCGAVYHWLETRDRRAHIAYKPFYGQGFNKAILRKTSDKREMWLTHELKALFESPAFTGCRSSTKRMYPGKLIIKDRYYWVFLCCVYLGLRLDEICSTNLVDIVERFGILCLWVPKGKTDNANRLIPIHPDLLKLGFREYVEKLKKNGSIQLFPELQEDAIHGGRATAMSEFFTRYRRSIRVYKKLKDAHSLRHSFITYLQNLDVSTERVAELVGHERKGQTSTTYFHGTEVQKLYDAISRWSFGLVIERVGDEMQIIAPVPAHGTMSQPEAA